MGTSYKREYYLANRDKIRARSKAYRIANVEKYREGLRKWYQNNKQKVLAASKKRYENGKRTHKTLCVSKDILWKYDLTMDEFISMFETQQYRCAICGVQKMTHGINGLVIDHDHATGKIRGLLCSSCNTGLGLFKDGQLFEAASLYLGKIEKGSV